MLETDDPHDHRLALGRHRAAARRSTRPACWTPPTCTSRAGSPRSPARRRAASRSPSRSPCAPSAAGSVCVDLAAVARRLGPRRPAVAGRRRVAAPRSPPARCRRAARCCGCSSRPAALPRPLLARGGAGLRRPARPAGAGAAGRPTRPPLDGGARPGLPAEGVRRAAGRGRGSRSSAVDHRAHRRPRHRQDHHGGRAAGPARRAGAARRRRPLRIALAAPTGKAAARLQQAVERRGPRGFPSRPGPARPADGGDPAPAARLPARHADPVPAPPRQPAARTTWSSSTRRSMVSLTMMARLLEAVRPETRLMLVGDPDQLASVEAGAVLADLVEGLAGRDDPRSPRCAPPTGSASPSGALAEALRARRRRRGARAARGGRRAGRVRRRPTTRPPLLRALLVAQRARRAAAAERGDADARAGGARTGTGCCAPTARAPTAYATGTGRSSAGSPRRPGSRSGRRGTPAGRCWSPPTTTALGSTTATPASSCVGRRPAAGPHRGAPPRPRSTSRPAGSARSRPCTR